MADLARLYDFVAETVIKSGELDDEFNQLIARINDLPPEALQTVVAEALGLSQPGVVRRGRSVVATEEARTNTAYGLMATPDQVDDVVVPAGGKLYVSYLAMWKSSVASAGRAAIFIGSNQLKVAVCGGALAAAPQFQAAPLDGLSGAYHLLSSCAQGLASQQVASGQYTGHVTTGQVIGVVHDSSLSIFPLQEVAGSSYGTSAAAAGSCEITVPAGTYDVSVQFKATSGSVTVSNRTLWVEAKAF